MWDCLDSIEDKSTERSYYEIIGCSETATVEQITTEYKIRALKLHPDKNPTNELAVEEFKKLQEARDVLTDSEKRKSYDEWRNSGIAVTFQKWKSINNRCKMTMHWATPKMGIMLEDKPKQVPLDADWNIDLNCAPGSTNVSEGKLGDIKWGHVYGQSWESDNRRGVYNQFRNYKI